MQSNLNITPATPHFTSAYATTLKSLRPIEVESLHRAMTELKDTKFWDLVVDEFGPKIQSKFSKSESLRGFTPERKPMLGELWIRALKDEDIRTQRPQDVYPRSLCLFFDSNEEAKDVYQTINKLNNEGNEVEVASIITKFMDKMSDFKSKFKK